MTNTMNDRRAALDTILLAHTSTGGALSCILDYADDPACISSPHLIAALDILHDESDPDMIDITRTLELIDEISPEIAAALAERAELCADHYCDPENCADQH